MGLSGYDAHMNLTEAINIMFWRVEGWQKSHLHAAAAEFAQEFAHAEGAVRAEILIVWDDEDNGPYLAFPSESLGYCQGPAGLLVEWEDDRVEVITPYDLSPNWEHMARQREKYVDEYYWASERY